MWWALAGSGSGSGRYEDRPAGIRSPTHGNLEVVAAASSKGKRRSKGFVAQWQVALLGIALVMAGEVMFWNVPYKHINFQEYIINVFILGSAFIAASLCLAEITGTLPFAGGIYGYVRVTCGPYAGYIIGCCEMLQNIVYTAAYMIPFGDICAFSLGLDIDTFGPVLAFLTLTIFAAINVLGGKVFWACNSILAIVAICIILIYIFSTASHADFSQNQHHQVEFSSKNRQVFYCVQYLNYTAWFFGGIEMIPLTCGDAIKARKNVPKAILISISVLFIFAVALVTLGASLSPGSEALGYADIPLMAGFMQGLHVSPRVAAALTLPGLGVSSFSFIYIYGKQMRSLAESNLLPKFLNNKYGKHDTPYAAIITGTILAYILLFIFYYSIDEIFIVIMGVTNSASYLLYISIPLCYWVYKRRYDTLPKELRSPLDKYGAIYSFLILMVAFLSMLCMHEMYYYVIPAFVLFIICLSIFYIFYVRHHQGFSPEEQKVLFAAYVINSNRRQKSKLIGGNKARKWTNVSLALQGFIEGSKRSNQSSDYSKNSNSSSDNRPHLHAHGPHQKKPLWKNLRVRTSSSRTDDQSSDEVMKRQMNKAISRLSTKSGSTTNSSQEYSVSYIRRMLSTLQGISDANMAMSNSGKGGESISNSYITNHSRHSNSTNSNNRSSNNGSRHSSSLSPTALKLPTHEVMHDYVLEEPSELIDGGYSEAPLRMESINEADASGVMPYAPPAGSHSKSSDEMNSNRHQGLIQSSSSSSKGSRKNNERNTALRSSVNSVHSFHSQNTLTSYYQSAAKQNSVESHPVYVFSPPNLASPVNGSRQNSGLSITSGDRDLDQFPAVIISKKPEASRQGGTGNGLMQTLSSTFSYVGGSKVERNQFTEEGEQNDANNTSTNESNTANSSIRSISFRLHNPALTPSSINAARIIPSDIDNTCEPFTDNSNDLL